MEFISINNLINISEVKKCQISFSHINEIKLKEESLIVGKSKIINAIEMYKKNQNMTIYE